MRPAVIAIALVGIIVLAYLYSTRAVSYTTTVPENGTLSVSGTKKITTKSATWGPVDGSLPAVNVLSKVQAAIDGKTAVSFVASNDNLGGDPSPGLVKQMVVTYTLS